MYLPSFIASVKELAEAGYGWEDAIVMLELDPSLDRDVRRIVLEHPARAVAGDSRAAGAGNTMPGGPAINEVQR